MNTESLYARIAQACTGLEPQLVTLRRVLHAHAEVGLDLPETQRIILEFLGHYPELEVQTGDRCSSVTAVLRAGGTSGTKAPAAVLLRGDMDALPIVEQTGHPFAPAQPGAMHACGHDLHMATLCGAVDALYAVREDLERDVIFMFQPGEEGAGGAVIMIEEGVLEAAGKPVEAAYSLHVFSAGMERGVFRSRPGTLMAGVDELRVVLTGRGGHGSTPHRTIDPIPVASEIVLALQTVVSRSLDIFDPAVVTVGAINAGNAANVIPETAELAITMRSYSPETRSLVRDKVKEIISGIARTHRVTVEFTESFGFPVTTTDPDAHAHAMRVLAAELGADRVREMANPMPGSEDFSFILERVPGAMLLLGAPAPGADFETALHNHAPSADFDESVIADGARALAVLAASHHSLEPGQR